MTDISTTIPATRPRQLLRTALRLDAVVSAANGAAYLVAAGPLGDLLGLSAPLLRGVGAFLLAYAAFVWLAQASRASARIVVAGNAAWAAGSIVAAIAGWGDPTTAGTVWIVMQGVVVAGFAELQLAGLRRRDG